MSACSLAGRVRRRPLGCLMGGTASISAAKTVWSGRLAPVRPQASGRPWRSTTRWCFVPGWARSVGFGPVAWPPLWPARWRYPRWRATSRGARPRRGGPAAHDGAPATRPPPASRASAASRSPRCRTPAPGAASATGARSPGRTGCRTARAGRAARAAHPWGVDAAAAAAARSAPRVRRRPNHAHSCHRASKPRATL